MAKAMISEMLKCKQCKGKFYVPCKDNWAYKFRRKGDMYFCSWSCLRAYEREHGEKKKYNRKAEAEA